jgi:hypothetical protein
MKICIRYEEFITVQCSVFSVQFSVGDDDEEMLAAQCSAVCVTVIGIIVYAGHNEPTVTAVSIEMSGVLLIVGIILLKVEHFTPLTLCTR